MDGVARVVKSPCGRFRFCTPPAGHSAPIGMMDVRGVGWSKGVDGISPEALAVLLDFIPAELVDDARVFFEGQMRLTEKEQVGE